MSSPNSPDQILLIDKPAGLSSFGVVARIRRLLRDQFGRKIKVGHTGTLDPFATGLLILLSGHMTKKSADFLKLDKTYEATLRLGYTSTTGDPEGEITPYQSSLTNSANPQNHITNNPPAPESSAALNDSVAPSLAIVESALKTFLGPQLQTVPKFSAVKIHGQRAYQLARRGQDFETPTRPIEIYHLEILGYAYPELTIRCHVSSGTYIRTLAEDIGAKLGTGAYLTALRRTTVGSYSVEKATKLDDFALPNSPKSTNSTQFPPQN